jgi:hypothetical protein
MATDRFMSELCAIRAETLKALSVCDGVVWTNATGELHYQYKEMPNWIELAKAADLQAAHAEFLSIVSPYFDRLGDVNIKVAYSVGGKQLAFLNSNKEIRDAFSRSNFGA